MLARSFLPASDLRLSESDRNALIKMLGMLERGELKHKDFLGKTEGFNMVNFSNPCGTVHCIAGWSDKLFGTNFEVAAEDDNDALDDLFCMPNYSGREMSRVTPGQAATALTNFLTTGDAKWDEIIVP